MVVYIDGKPDPLPMENDPTEEIKGMTPYRWKMTAPRELER